MGVTFEIDHIVPRSAGGETRAKNLCLSCPPCNRHKAARLGARDPKSGEEVSLYHPNNQAWSDVALLQFIFYHLPFARRLT
jgi:5-methylcytosine-specific restriction endonuclease McrA